jgi:hypothetical protein
MVKDKKPMKIAQVMESSDKPIKTWVPSEDVFKV